MIDALHPKNLNTKLKNKREIINQRAALTDLAKRTPKRFDTRRCRAFGDAYFVASCPTASVLAAFREALPSEVEKLFSVRARTRENPISCEQLAELGITPEVIAGQIASGRIKGWVCLHEQNLIGFCNGDGQTGEVLVLAVLPDYERRGIGSNLLAHVVEWLR